MAMLSAWIVVALFVVVGIIATVVLFRKDASEPSALHRPALLLVGRFLALLYAGLGILGTIISTVATIVNDSVVVALPVREFWPGAYPWITFDPAPTASVVSGGFSTADVMVTGLGMDARLWLAAGSLVQGVTVVVIAVVIALLCHRLLGGRPFRPLLARATTWAAVAITAGGIAWQILFDIGRSMASEQVLGVSGYSGQVASTAIADYVFTVFPDSGLPEPTLAATLEFWPLFIGLALAAVAAAFRYSERLQNDTERLQLDKKKLQKDTEGLV